MEDNIHSTSIQKLQEISHLLHLAHHRNKNQHRVARWYKFFGQLRRQIAKLMLELDAFTTTIKMIGITKIRMITTDLVKSNKYLAVVQLKIAKRTEFMQQFLIPKCYLAFENLIADNQYAVLGLMLMGLLANLNGILPMLPSINIEEKNPDNIDTEPKCIKENAIRDPELHDLGEIISRQEFNERHQECENQEKIGKKSTAVLGLKQQRKRNLLEGPRTEEVKSHPHTKSRKKKTKKGDIFDDIFKKLL